MTHFCAPHLQSTTTGKGREVQILASQSEQRDGEVGRTGFHPVTCSSFQMPGTLAYPPARAAIKVASVIASVPGTLVRCL